ncbi:O-antigen ligase [Erysipelothrix urinaevulpis]|uniref:O-antigen ligase family protein n=1 Tax=Erysipelothrix urinaevulpis TaxID=2683717 RepID=UPI00135A756D|nr:O-antigen ligase family protein [Erysipelothrix urinaevulpis]
MKINSKKLYNTLFNPSYIQLFFIVFPLVLETPMLLPLLNSYLKIGLVWGAAYLAFDLFHERRFLEDKHRRLLLLFVGFYTITMIINIKNPNSRMNLIGYFYIVVQMLIITIQDTDRQVALRKLKFISKTIITVTLVYSIIGLILFIIQYHDILIYSNKRYVLGFYSNRLVGIYRGITSATISIGVMSAFTYMNIVYREDRKVSKYALVTLLVNFVHLSLSSSRGILYSLLAYVLVLFFLYAIYFFKEITIKGIVKSLVVSAVIAGLLSGAISGTKKAMSYLPSWYAHNYVYVSQLDEETGEAPDIDEGPIDLHREIPEKYGALTGRPVIWKQGFEAIKKKPIFGYGAYSHANMITLGFSSEVFSHYHSFYIHSMFSAGILGSLPLFAFIVIAAIKVLKYLFDKNNLTDKDYLIIATLAASYVFFVVVGFSDTTNMFINRFEEYYFWTILTIGLSFLKIKKLKN